MTAKRVFGGLEAGGSKFLCAAGFVSEGPDILVRGSIPTSGPAETLDRVIRCFRAQMKQHPIAAIGIACFGPLDLDPASPKFGFISNTPKPDWSGVDIRGELNRALNLPVAIDTDVNAAALAEHCWGAAQELDNVLYMTVGTGIGGGALINGRPVIGLTHPEMGHVRIPHDFAADPYPGCCPYHGDCLEGLASGPAMERRWGIPATALPQDHPAWALEARYLALGLANLVCTLSPRCVVIGGGIMHQAGLIGMVQHRLSELLGGYVPAPEVVPPKLGDDAGVLGALILAQRIAS